MTGFVLGVLLDMWRWHSFYVIHLRIFHPTFLPDVYNGYSLGHYTHHFCRIFPPKQMLQYIILTAKQKSLFGAMLLKEIIKTNDAQIKSRISRQWFTPDLFEKWDFPAFSDMLTSATDTCTCSSVKSG